MGCLVLTQLGTTVVDWNMLGFGREDRIYKKNYFTFPALVTGNTVMGTGIGKEGKMTY